MFHDFHLQRPVLIRALASLPGAPGEVQVRKRHWRLVAQSTPPHGVVSFLLPFLLTLKAHWRIIAPEAPKEQS